MTDPRLGFPSASAMWRVANCPGSQTMITSLRELGKYHELPSADAQRGQSLHDFLALDALGGTAQAGDFRSSMNADDRALVEKAIEIRDCLVREWRGERSANGTPIIERRFYYRQGLSLRFSGQPDYVLIEGTRALDINYKTGRKEAQAAADNLQLRTEIVLLKHHFPFLTEITGAIDEPFVTWDPERVVYVGEDLLKAEAQILAFCDRAEWEKETRVAGPWCQYCPARAYCPEARDYVLSLNPTDEKAVVELPIGEPGSELWRRLSVVEHLIESLRLEYTRIMEENPDALPGYILPKQGRSRRIVPYPARLKTALAAHLTPEEIDGCAEFYVGKLETLFKVKFKLPSADKTFGELVRDAVSIIHDKPYIRALTKKERENS